MRRVCLVLLLSVRTHVALAENVEVEGLRGDFRKCHAIADTGRRATCYDGLYTRLNPPTFKGSLSDETQLFEIKQPTLLRYQSDGAIFVMYLKDKNGTIVQNLHIGGGGESTYLVTRPGLYSLQISGSETWRVWIEPAAPSHE